MAKRSAPKRRAARRVAPARPTGPAADHTRVRYLESSALVAALLERDTAVVRKFLDLDHFKAVNDTCGHLAGDAVLRAVADCLKHELRGYDAVGRSGGEEFVAFLPGVTPEIALTIGERVRHRISTLDFADGLQVTASIGVAHFPSDAGELDALLAAADAALYSAKATGRDRVVAARGRP